MSINQAVIKESDRMEELLSQYDRAQLYFPPIGEAQRFMLANAQLFADIDEHPALKQRLAEQAQELETGRRWRFADSSCIVFKEEWAQVSAVPAAH